MVEHMNSKRAFFVAALAILICLSCLSGATYALFTSNVHDGTIGIVTTAGNVDVDIVDTVNGETLVDKTLRFVNQGEREVIYFEPGATFCTEGFRVENKGDITVNFRLAVSTDQNIDMDEFNKAFELWITTDPNARGDAERLTAFEGTLAPQGPQSLSETYYLFIRMRDTAGNTFQGKSYSGIGVTVYAVQGNVSIGN